MPKSLFLTCFTQEGIKGSNLIKQLDSTNPVYVTFSCSYNMAPTFETLEPMTIHPIAF